MKYASWVSAECPLQIEYAVEAVRDVRSMASKRNGVLGVLYGRLEGESLRIMSAQKTPSNADEHAWGKLCAAPPAGMVAAGLFAIRDEVELSKAESDLFRRVFPAPWQVALVMTRDGEAGFFARDYDGTLNPTESRGLFQVDDALELSTYTFGPIEASDAPRGSAWTSSALTWVLAGLLALAAGFSLGAFEHTKRLNLAIDAPGNRIVVSWDRAAVLRAESGVLDISDGPYKVTRNLTPTDLASGRLTFRRGTGDVSVRLRSRGLDEATRYVGRAPVSKMPDDVTALAQTAKELVTRTAVGDLQLRDMQATVARLSAKVTAAKP